jgi:hypothetical protein
MDPVEGPNSDLAIDSSPQISDPVYFPVSLIKLSVLSICTFNLYQIVWFHHNWRLIKEREHSKIEPIWRAIFSLVFIYPLLRKINKTAKAANLPTTTAVGLAAGWILFTLYGLSRDPFWIVSFLSFLFLLPAQRIVNKVNSHSAPNHNPNRFNGWNIAVAVTGGMLFILAIIGLFLPPA